MKCPSCGSERTWKDGLKYTVTGQIQRYLCRSCGYRFSDTTVKLNITRQSLVLSEPIQNLGDSNLVNSFPINEGSKNSPLILRKDIRSHVFTIVEKPTNSLLHNSREHQVGANKKKARNLVAVETQQQRPAGATTSTKADIKGKVIEYTWWMKKQGYAESTIRARSYIIKNLMKRGANLLNPDSVKDTIAKVDTWSESRKKVVTDTYTNFLSMLGLSWNPPRYKVTQKIPFIPMEREIDDLIANAGSKTSAALKIAKETGARIGEILRSKWIDLDEERKTIKFEAEKGSNPRILSVSTDLIAMLKTLPRPNEYIFPSSAHGHSKARNYGKLLALTRKTLARKLQNPRLLKITYHTIRHWKGTLEYHKTKDIIHVQQILGHKSINNTMIYINLERAIFKETNDEFTVRATSSVEEACKFIEVGFEYVCDMNGKKLFRKRK